MSNITRRFAALRKFLAMASKAGKESGRGTVSQVMELARLKRRTGLTGLEYFTYEFHTNRLNQAEKLQFLTRALHERYLAPLNPPAESSPIPDKIAFKLYFEGAGLRVPKTFGVFHAQLGRDIEGAALKTAGDLRRVARRAGPAGFVVKPARGGCGEGVMVFAGSDAQDADTLTQVDGRKMTITQLYARLSGSDAPKFEGYLIEERVKQHPFLSAFNPSTLHTTRVVTLRTTDGTVHPIGATLKLGLDDSGVESLPENHVCVPVNWETGELGLGAQRNGWGYKRLSAHPRSGVEFRGRRMPMWDDVKTQVMKAAAEAPGLRSLGWDVGLAEDGPVLIEANEVWGEELLQVASGKGIWTPEFRGLIGAPERLE